MGDVIKTRLHIAGRAYEGEAQLESGEIRFRGERRLVMPLSKLTAVRAEGGKLEVVHDGVRVVLDLGPRAEKWAHRISNPKTLIEKLGVKQGQRVWLVRVDDTGFVADLDRLGVDAHRSAPSIDCDAIFVCVDSKSQLEQLRRLVPRLANNGALWVLRPKGSKKITEADVRIAGQLAGLVDVKVVSFSEQTTAEKFVIPRASRSARKSSARR